VYYYGARYYDPRISIFVSVDPLAEQTMEPYLYTGNNPIMFTDPTGMSKDGIDNDYLLDENNKIIGVHYNNNKDRYFKKSNKSSTSQEFNFKDGSTHYGEEVSVNFSIIEIYNEVEGNAGHTGIAFDGNVYSYYPISDSGDYPGAVYGDDLGQVTHSQTEFRNKYPLANSFFIKASLDQKDALVSDISNRNNFLNKSNENYVFHSNNCTTNASNHLINTGILSLDSHRKRPGRYNSMLKSNNEVSSHIIMESSLWRTAKQNVSLSLNDVTFNGKRIKK